jgi:hypothetical protein
MTEDSSTITINETPPALSNQRQQQKAHPLLGWFTCTNLMSQVFKCHLCGWQPSRARTRRKLHTHVLGMGNGVKHCPKQSDLDIAVRESLLVDLETLNRKQATKKRNTELETTATMAISCPKRQRRMKFATNDETEDTHMLDARMLIMSAVKSNFMDSSFTRNFFQVSRSPFRYICLSAASIRLHAPFPCNYHEPHTRRPVPRHPKESARVLQV